MERRRWWKNSRLEIKKTQRINHTLEYELNTGWCVCWANRVISYVSCAWVFIRLVLLCIRCALHMHMWITFSLPMHIAPHILSLSLDLMHVGSVFHFSSFFFFFRRLFRYMRRLPKKCKRRKSLKSVQSVTRGQIGAKIIYIRMLFLVTRHTRSHCPRVAPFLMGLCEWM